MRVIASLLAWVFLIGAVCAQQMCVTCGTPPIFAAPCDLLTCAEAHSVTRSLTVNYSGPLFQLYNGSSTLDIGQTAGHKVDLSTWSAFCGGVASNCVYGKIYAQIQTSQNDLAPSTVSPPFGPNCSTGGTYQCAASFSFEVATDLPVFSAAAPAEYTIGGTDVQGTGITGLGASVSVVYNGQAIKTSFCCAAYGLSHKYNAGDVVGTNFIVYAAYGTTAVAPSGICATSTTFCTGVGFEESGVPGDYGSSGINLITMANYNSATGVVTTMYNGHSLYSGIPAGVTFNTKQFIHLAGGGDLSQPAPVFMREAFITNSVISSLQTAQIVTNSRAFYSQLSFP